MSSSGLARGSIGKTAFTLDMDARIKSGHDKVRDTRRLAVTTAATIYFFAFFLAAGFLAGFFAAGFFAAPFALAFGAGLPACAAR